MHCSLLWAHSLENFCGSLLAVIYTHNHLILIAIVAFMFILPMGFEIFSEQSKILAKIQMQMMNDSMMGGGMGGMDAAPTIRPF